MLSHVANVSPKTILKKLSDYTPSNTIHHIIISKDEYFQTAPNMLLSVNMVQESKKNPGEKKLKSLAQLVY